MPPQLNNNKSARLKRPLAWNLFLRRLIRSSFSIADFDPIKVYYLFWCCFLQTVLFFFLFWISSRLCVYFVLNDKSSPFFFWNWLGSCILYEYSCFFHFPFFFLCWHSVMFSSVSQCDVFIWFDFCSLLNLVLLNGQISSHYVDRQQVYGFRGCFQPKCPSTATARATITFKWKE